MHWALSAAAAAPDEAAARLLPGAAAPLRAACSSRCVGLLGYLGSPAEAGCRTRLLASQLQHAVGRQDGQNGSS